MVLSYNCSCTREMPLLKWFRRLIPVVVALSLAMSVFWFTSLSSGQVSQIPSSAATVERRKNQTKPAAHTPKLVIPPKQDFALNSSSGHVKNLPAPDQGIKLEVNQTSALITKPLLTQTSVHPPPPLPQEDEPVQVATRSSRNGKRAIFCATSGHTGTHLLTSLLDVLPQTISEHEPTPQMLLDQFKGALPATRKKRQQVKLGSILQKMSRQPDVKVYAEMSHMFIKAFWDLDWYSHFDTVHVIILRYWGPGVVRAHVNRGLGDDAFRKTTSWLSYVDTMKLEDAAIPWPADAKPTSMARMTYMTLDVEERIQRLKKDLAGKVKFVEVVYEELVKADAGYMKWLFSELGYTMTDALVSNLQGEIGGKPKSTKRLENAVTEQECNNAMWEFILQHQIKMDPRGLQALMQHPAKRHVKVVAVAQVWQASEYIATWLTMVLSYADSVVLVDDHSSDTTVSIAEGFAPRVTVLTKTAWSFEEHSAQRRGLDEALRQNASHIVCLDTDEVPTANILPYARALVSSLPPGASAEFFLWHPWNGITEVVESAAGWTTVQVTPVAYSPTAESATKWGQGVHHIGRLPGGVRVEADIKVPKKLGGLLHFKYANLEAYNVMVSWYKMMEWLEVVAGNAKKEPRLASPRALAQFYDTKFPKQIKTMPIPASWVRTLDLEPFHAQRLTRAAREQQMAVWRASFSQDDLGALLGPKTAAVVAALSPHPASNQAPSLSAPPASRPSPPPPAVAAPSMEPISGTVAPVAALPSPAPSAAVAQVEAAPAGGGVRFVLVLGVEGAGFLAVSGLVGPGARQLLGDPAFREAHLQLKRSLWNQKQPAAGLFTMHCAAPSGNIFSTVVARLQALQRLAATAALHTTAVVPLNLPDEAAPDLVMYPKLLGECRRMQYPDLDAMYRACDAAGVQCSHLLVLRDPLSAVQSAMRRGAEPVLGKQMRATSLTQTVIAAQMQSHLRRPHWCWHYADADVRPLAQALGWSDVAALQKQYAAAFKNKQSRAAELQDEMQTEGHHFLGKFLQGSYKVMLQTCSASA